MMPRTDEGDGRGAKKNGEIGRTHVRKKTVLVTAGFGNQARSVIPRLGAAGFGVRAMRARDRPGPGPLDLGAHEVVVGDAANPRDAFEALQGVHAVYHVGPTFHPLERQMGFNIIEQAGKAGVEHFVFSSVLHPILTGLPQHAIKRDIEERLLESGLNFTILQPSDYMQMSAQGYLADHGIFIVSFDLDNRQALVDLDDVAEVLARVLREGPAHYGATYELTSNDNLTAHEIAAALSQATGRKVNAAQIPTSDEQLAGFFGVTDLATVSYQVNTLRTVSAWYDKFDFIGNANVLRMLLGREPTSYLEFARRVCRWVAGQQCILVFSIMLLFLNDSASSLATYYVALHYSTDDNEKGAFQFHA
jgi:uncharacterized protein YbjT (DUF2867 family)